MRTSTSLLTLSLACLLGACSATKSSVDDDFSSLAGMDTKSDAFSYRMKIVGSLDYGQTSDTIRYSSYPRYRAIKFGGNPGDSVDVWVRSAHGDAVAWVLDNSFDVLGSNDDADDTTLDSHIALTLPGSDSITHYVVFRDYYLDSHDFTIELGGGPSYDTSCATDADCIAVPTGGCCIDGTKTAINAGSVDAYEAATACTADPRPLCPQHEILDTRVAECDRGSLQCVMIAPEDIQCGGFIANLHLCPDGYTCQLVGNFPDAPGSCVAL